MRTGRRAVECLRHAWRLELARRWDIASALGLPNLGHARHLSSAFALSRSERRACRGCWILILGMPCKGRIHGRLDTLRRTRLGVRQRWLVARNEQRVFIRIVIAIRALYRCIRLRVRR